ncbi:hypothetical protein HOY80DRAFT_1017485 [Tuber brumale]|nr:hypothetical protein HOY80DRAFT_1017485 [Tuber brumale]
MVLLHDDIKTKLRHAGMVSGRKTIRVRATNKETQEKELVGEVEIGQPVSALYIYQPRKSREVWDRADRHFMDNCGMVPQD